MFGPAPTGAARFGFTLREKKSLHNTSLISAFSGHPPTAIDRHRNG
jgi:hypothetical protein